jgi:hypothetical protein
VYVTVHSLIFAVELEGRAKITLEVLAAILEALELLPVLLEELELLLEPPLLSNKEVF